jgi:exonuclease SbcC
MIQAAEKQQQAIHETSITLATREKQLADKQALVSASSREDSMRIEALETARDKAKLSHSEMLGRLAVTQEQLRRDTEQRGLHGQFAAEISAADTDRQRWGRLSGLIGAATGITFSKFAQGLTLERLVALANHHLQQLSPRYWLQRDGRRIDDLELEIVDRYQANTARPMQSLSGGESFLASLALALGLSELAGGKSRIDSLFVDEGFGTLDAETIEVAMSALETLRSSGKTIGVISHVEAMKERIATQIRVVKTDGGCSRLEWSDPY